MEGPELDAWVPSIYGQSIRMGPRGAWVSLGDPAQSRRNLSATEHPLHMCSRGSGCLPGGGEAQSVSPDSSPKASALGFGTKTPRMLLLLNGLRLHSSPLGF